MTAPGAGGTRPARAAGLLLMGIAVIAVVLGVITLVDGNAENNGGGGGTTSSRPPTPPTSGSRTTGPTTTTGTPPASTPPASTPPQTTTNNPPPQPPPANPRSVPVRVLNNGTITGLAAQAARDFRADGWNVVEVGNYSQGIIPTSTAYFRAGTLEETAAQELARKFGMRAEARFPGIANASPGVIVMITNDYGGK